MFATVIERWTKKPLPSVLFRGSRSPFEEMSIETFVKELSGLNPKILESKPNILDLKRRDLCLLRLGKDLGLDNNERWRLLRAIEDWLDIQYDSRVKPRMSAHDVATVQSLHFATLCAVRKRQGR